MDLIVTPKEAARLLGVHVSTVLHWLQGGDIKHAAKVGRNGNWFINLSREFPELFGQIEPQKVASSTAHGRTWKGR